VQIVPASWVGNSATPDSSYFMPGRIGADQEELLGYEYQWRQTQAEVL